MKKISILIMFLILLCGCKQKPLDLRHLSPVDLEISEEASIHFSDFFSKYISTYNITTSELVYSEGFFGQEMERLITYTIKLYDSDNLEYNLVFFDNYEGRSLVILDLPIIDYSQNIETVEMVQSLTSDMFDLTEENKKIILDLFLTSYDHDGSDDFYIENDGYFIEMQFRYNYSTKKIRFISP